MASLGQTSSDYPIYWQILERSAKSKIPDRLGLPIHMKTRLYDRGRIALRLQSNKLASLLSFVQLAGAFVFPDTKRKKESTLGQVKDHLI